MNVEDERVLGDLKKSAELFLICAALFLFIGINFGYWWRATGIALIAALFYGAGIGRRRLAQLAFAITVVGSMIWVEILPPTNMWGQNLKSFYTLMQSSALAMR